MAKRKKEKSHVDHSTIFLAFDTTYLLTNNTQFINDSKAVYKDKHNVQTTFLQTNIKISKNIIQFQTE